MSYLNSKPVGAKELFVIDGALPDVQSLIDSIGAEKWIFVLDPQRDGVNQLAEFLGAEFGLSAIHILSHGSAGRLNLGTAVLEQSSIANYLDTLQAIGKALTDTGDLLLYGCNVAEGNIGQTFIAQLASVTGADVAASTDLTGLRALGGNWTLERATGDLEATPLGLQDAPMLLADDYYALGNGKLWSFLADCSLAAYEENDSLRNELIGPSSSWDLIPIPSLAGSTYYSNTGRYEYGSDGAFIAYSASNKAAVISFEGTTSVYDWQHDISGMFPSVVNLVPIIDAFDAFVSAMGITNRVYPSRRKRRSVRRRLPRGISLVELNRRSGGDTGDSTRGSSTSDSARQGRVSNEYPTPLSRSRPSP